MQYSREHIEKIHKDVGGLEGLGYQERLATLHGAKVVESWYDTEAFQIMIRLRPHIVSHSRGI